MFTLSITACLLISDEDVNSRLKEGGEGDILSPVDDTGGDTDTGTDTSTDTGTDTSIDTGTDTGTDTNIDTNIDTSTDTGTGEDTDTSTDTGIGEDTDTGEDTGTEWPGIYEVDWTDMYSLRGGTAYAYTFNMYGQATNIVATCDDSRITVAVNDPDTTSTGWGTATMSSSTDGVVYSADDGLDGASGVYATCWLESDQNAPAFFVSIYPY